MNVRRVKYTGCHINTHFFEKIEFENLSKFIFKVS